MGLVSWAFGPVGVLTMVKLVRGGLTRRIAYLVVADSARGMLSNLFPPHLTLLKQKQKKIINGR